jgi:hypothetical protein
LRNVDPLFDVPGINRSYRTGFLFVGGNQKRCIEHGKRKVIRHRETKFFLSKAAGARCRGSWKETERKLEEKYRYPSDSVVPCRAAE